MSDSSLEYEITHYLDDLSKTDRKLSAIKFLLEECSFISDETKENLRRRQETTLVLERLKETFPLRNTVRKEKARQELSDSIWRLETERDELNRDIEQLEKELQALDAPPPVKPPRAKKCKVVKPPDV